MYIYVCIRCGRFNSGVLSFVPIFQGEKGQPNSESGERSRNCFLARECASRRVVCVCVIRSHRRLHRRLLPASTLVHNRLALWLSRPIESYRRSRNKQRKVLSLALSLCNARDRERSMAQTRRNFTRAARKLRISPGRGCRREPRQLGGRKRGGVGRDRQERAREAAFCWLGN